MFSLVLVLIGRRLIGKVYSRPDAKSIDTWGTVNDADWSWDTLLPFYIASESLRIPSDELQRAGNTYEADFHGISGPVNTTFPAIGNEDFWQVLKETAANFSIETVTDFNGGDARGLAAYPFQATIAGAREQRRESAREAYYLPAVGRANLELLDETSCLKIVWASANDNSALVARGVEIANANIQTTVSARKEVILSTGVYRSPTILEFSGVGNAKILANYNIESKIDLPGVGENLQDQTQGVIYFDRIENSTISFLEPVGEEITTNYLIHATVEDIFGEDDVKDIQDRVKGSLSEYASSVSDRINGSLSAEQISRSLQVQYEALFQTKVPAVELFTGQNLNSESLWLEFWPLIPLSRGSVHVSGGNAQISGLRPAVDPNWFMLDYDWDVFLASARFVRRFFQAAPLAAEVTGETRPGLENVAADASDDEWKAYWEENYRPGWHAIGSCAMLPREWGGVVDGDLKVYGTSNVRVIDASVIPFQLGGHPTSTLYALAERAASLIVG